MRHGVVAGAASRCPALAEMPARQRICARPPLLRRDEPEMQCFSATLRLCVAFATAVPRLGHTARPLWPPRTAPNAYHVHSALPPRDSNMAGLPTHPGLLPVEFPALCCRGQTSHNARQQSLGHAHSSPTRQQAAPAIYIYIYMYISGQMHEMICATCQSKDSGDHMAPEFVIITPARAVRFRDSPTGWALDRAR